MAQHDRLVRREPLRDALWMLPKESKPPYFVAVHPRASQMPRQFLEELSAGAAPPRERAGRQHMRCMHDGINNFDVGSFPAEQPCARTWAQGA